MQCPSTQYHASFQHRITFNFQLHTYPLFKHQLPIHPWSSIFYPMIIIEQPSSHSHQSTCPIQITSGIFEDPSDLEMEGFAKPNCILKLKQSFQSLQSTQCE